MLSQGENEIKVRVDNTAFPADRWYSGCGIYRTVTFIEAEERRFDEMEIIVSSRVLDTGAAVSIKTGTNSKVRAVLDGNKTRFEATGDDGNVEIFVAKPMLWSAESPNLYDLRLTLLDGERAADEISMRIGIRDIQFIPGQGIFVNGQRTILKGVCLHQDVGCRGIASKKEHWRERLVILKELGCNCIRPAHHLFPAEFLDLCDEMGFYVYEEAFDKWTSGSYARYFQECWREDIDAMVKRDRNRASVLIWGTGNEVENQGLESMLSILTMLKDYIKTLDDSRPVSYAMNPHFERVCDNLPITDIEEKVGQIAKIADIVDIISCNYQEQWYDTIHESRPGKLILGTEVYQFFRGHRDQLQNYSNENPLLAPLEKDYVIGSIVWSGYDYLGESADWPAKGWGGALVRTNNEKRFGYYIAQSYWSEKPMVCFNVMDYSLASENVKEHWDMPIFAEHWFFPQYGKIIIPYMIATNCDDVALFLNGTRFYLPKPSDCPNRIITGFLPYRPGTVKAVGYINGTEVCSHTLVTPSPAVRLEFTESVKRVVAERGFEMLLTVKAKDENGNPCFRESSLVRFRAEGGAEICAVDNGCLTGSEPCDGTSIHMYRGVASLLIHLDGSPGRVVVHADAEGLFSGEAIVIVG